jgi:hypothetical protein
LFPPEPDQPADSDGGYDESQPIVPYLLVAHAFTLLPWHLSEFQETPDCLFC